MKSAPSVYSDALALPRSRLSDYVELTKPRVSLLVLFTVAAGFLLASPTTPDMILLVHALVGTALVAAGASALNQLLERHSDALMERTEDRPLPSGRLHPVEVLLFGLAMGTLGLVYLAVATREPWCVLVAAFTFASYVLVYTPLKSRSTLNTLAGAVPGAMPPVIGWTACGGPLGPQVAVLFLLLFLWQVPHFLAIAWIYREDYGRAGLRMLTVDDDRGTLTARHMVLYCLTLVPVSLSPVILGQAGWGFAAGALAVGMAFLASTLGFMRARSVAWARRVLHASLIYLPVILVLLLLQPR